MYHSITSTEGHLSAWPTQSKQTSILWQASAWETPKKGSCSCCGIRIAEALSVTRLVVSGA